MKRRSTDPRFTVETPRSSGPAILLLALVIAAIAWSIRESMVDDLSPPYTSSGEPVTGAEPTGEFAVPVPARGNLAGLFSSDDYPVDALNREEQGTVHAELVVSERGKVIACKVLSSSGSASLDLTTCNILTKRARFTPAMSSDGRTVAGTFTQRITWRLES
jgi:protein TonB